MSKNSFLKYKNRFYRCVFNENFDYKIVKIFRIKEGSKSEKLNYYFFPAIILVIFIKSGHFWTPSKNVHVSIII